MLIYTEEKKFTKEQIQKLFLSVHWISGNYPDWLYKALMNSSTVLTVWDDEKLVGLTRVLDDNEMLAQIHYVLERTGINQADISKLENGTRNHSVNLLKRLADGMGMALKIEFVTKQKAWLYDLTGLLSGEVIILRRKNYDKSTFYLPRHSSFVIMHTFADWATRGRIWRKDLELLQFWLLRLMADEAE